MKDNNLNEVRGSVFQYQGYPVICSYFPQDAADIKNYEAEHQKRTNAEYEDDDDDDDEYDEKSRHNKTKRKNFAFWLIQDVKKCKTIIQKAGVPKLEVKPNYILYPSVKDIIKTLEEPKDEFFYFDIETDYHDPQLQCFSYSFGNNPSIYCVPFMSHNYELYHTSLETAKILRALANVLDRNIAVAHNGSGFDFVVLPWRYGIPLGRRMYDTMLAMHRCYPEVEKSLGHCTSLWTWETFHKDEGSGGYFTTEQVTNKMRYCGKDVFTMKLIHQAITQHARRIPGLEASIQQVMDGIYPYLVTSLTGIAYKPEVVKEVFDENDALMEQYIRMANMLIGKHWVSSIRGKSAKPMLNSNTQCVRYFHDLLGYGVVGWGKPSKKDGKRKPSLAKKNMYKLKLEYNNPVIDLCLAYREVIKESGSLKFTPLKESTNNERLHTTSSTNENGIESPN